MVPRDPAVLLDRSVASPFGYFLITPGFLRREQAGRREQHIELSAYESTSRDSRFPGKDRDRELIRHATSKGLRSSAPRNLQSAFGPVRRGTTPFEAINFWSTNSWALWFLGYPERAQASNRKSLAIGREVTASLGDLALALTLSAFFSLLLRDPKTAASHSDEAVVVAEIVNPDIEFLSQGRARVTHSYLRL
jgi:hypothetical protein